MKLQIFSHFKIEKTKLYLDQFNESYKKTPRMRSIHNEAFEQYSCNLLLDNFLQKEEILNFHTLTFHQMLNPSDFPHI